MTAQPQPVAIKPYRAIIGVGAPNTPQQTVTALQADAVIQEDHEDQMIITEQPIEQGSVITDHAYKLPAKVTLLYGYWSGSNQNSDQDSNYLNAIYQQFLTLQINRILCSVYTGKRVYSNMLIQTIALRTDKETENSMVLTINMQQLLLVTSQTVPLTTMAQQAIPTKTSPTINQGNQTLGSAPNFNGGATQ